LLLLPLYFVLFVVHHADIAAFVVFGVAASTDFLDGLAARRLGQVSKLGQQFDPFVDRLLIILGILGVFIVGRVPLWLLVVLLARDAVMLCITVYQRRCFGKGFEVIFLGKLTTAIVMLGFSLLILGLPVLPGAGLATASWLPGWGAAGAPLGIWLLYIGSGFSLATGAIYVRRALSYGSPTRGLGASERRAGESQAGESQVSGSLADNSPADNSPAAAAQAGGSEENSG
jgi:cardiolipin synthase